jgi:mannitol/fructose-specific phosphotransferase system IIA component (Ntr-type)
MALALADLLNEKHVDLDLRTRTFETALHKLVRLLEKDGQVTDTDIFLEQVLARERVHSTFVENGVAFPHARTELVDKIVLAMGRSRAGIAFAPEGQRAHLIFLIGVPQRLVSEYLVCVGALARLLKDHETRQKLLYAATPEEFVKALNVTDETRFD